MAGLAALIIGGAAVLTGITGMGISLGQAAKQRKKATQAAKDSKMIMQEARARMQKDAIQNLKIPMEAYDKAFRENTAQQMQAIESLQGADARTLAAGIGKVGAVGTDVNELQRIAMAEDLYKLDVKKAESANQVRDELVGMDVGEAKDLTTRAGDLQESSAASTVSGIQAGLAGLSAAAGLVADYPMSSAARQAGQFAKSETFKSMDKGGALSETAKQINPAWTNKGPDYDTSLTPKQEGYIPEFVPKWEATDPLLAQKALGKEWGTIFESGKEYRKWRKAGFKMEDLTPVQQARIRAILGENPYNK